MGNLGPVNTWLQATFSRSMHSYACPILDYRNHTEIICNEQFC
jgi:hypothetical protein